MANSWEYMVYLPGHYDRDTAILEKILDILSRSGFGLVVTKGNKIEVFDKNGLESISITTLEPLAQRVSQGGRTVYVQDGRNLIFLTINIPMNWVNLSVDWELDKTHDGGALAHEMELFIKTICKEFHPQYACTVDAWGLEGVTQDEFMRVYKDIEKAPERFVAPPVLFWLNYFSHDYYTATIQPRLQYYNVPQKLDTALRWFPGG